MHVGAKPVLSLPKDPHLPSRAQLDALSNPTTLSFPIRFSGEESAFAVNLKQQTLPQDAVVAGVLKNFKRRERV
jgi:hypothetical protein